MDLYNMLYILIDILILEVVSSSPTLVTNFAVYVSFFNYRVLLHKIIKRTLMLETCRQNRIITLAIIIFENT